MNEDKKVYDELSWLRKRVDMISSTLTNLKLTQGGEEVLVSSSRYNLESHRYVDSKVFQEFQKFVKRELEIISNRVDDGRSILEYDVLINLPKKASTEDLKSLEDFLIAKLEELKLGSTKKFADKNEVNKSIRYLDSQVKHIMDIYIKKLEKGDNWLLAKKPFNGNFCASCENPIGDLHDNNTYLPWNKMHPQHNDRIYRIGSGFSKMLQNLVIEGNERYVDDSESVKQHSRNKSNQNPTIPRVNSFRTHTKGPEQSMDMTNNDMKIENTLHEVYDDPNKPKVYVIY